MEDTIHSRVVGDICRLLGPQRLADRMRVSRATVDAWLAGTAVPPPRAYHRILNILKKADPQYRPL